MKRNKRIGLVGAGLMGKPMGLNWLKNGFELTVLPHKNLKSAEELKSKGARVASSLKELCESSDVIALMLPTSKEVEAVCGDLLPLMTGKKSYLIDMTTSDPKSTRKIAENMSAAGIKFFDSPVTGGVKGAVEGTLTLFIGGDLKYYQDCEDVLSAVSKVRTHFGSIGQGHVAKIINNFVCIGNLSVFAEALPLAIKMGLDAGDILKTLSAGTGNSRMLELYGEQILAGDFAPRFKLAHAFKDMGLAEALVKDLGAIDLPVLEGILNEFRRSMNAGLGEENIAALIKPIENILGSEFRK